MPNILIASLSTKLFESPNIYVWENDEASTVCDDNIIPVRKGSIRENQVSESRDIYSSLHRRQQLLSKTTWWTFWNVWLISPVDSEVSRGKSSQSRTWDGMTPQDQRGIRFRSEGEGIVAQTNGFQFW